MKCKLVLLPAILILLFQQGCSLFLPGTQLLTVTASEPDADFFIDGKYVGNDRVQVHVSRNSEHSLMARKGERTGRIVIGYGSSWTGWLDFIGAFVFIFPTLGLFAPGACALAEDDVTIDLWPGPLEQKEGVDK